MATTLAEREQVLEPKMVVGPNKGAGAARFVLGLALAGLSALLATWAFPPYGIWPLIFVAWVPMLVAQHRVLPRRWSWMAVAIGIGGYVAGYLHGVVDPSFAWWVACIPLVVALAAGLGAIGARNFDEATGYAFFVFTFPLIWTALEFLRGFAPGIGTQGYLAYALFREPWLLQPVSVLSVNALNLLILVVNWTIGLGVLMLLERRRPSGSRLISRRVMAVSGIFCAVAAGVWVCASLLMFQADPPTVTVAAIQPGVPGPGSVHASRDLTEDLSRDITQTRMAAKEGARIVVWQEGTLTRRSAAQSDRPRAVTARTGYSRLSRGRLPLRDCPGPTQRRHCDLALGAVPRRLWQTAPGADVRRGSGKCRCGDDARVPDPLWRAGHHDLFRR